MDDSILCNCGHCAGDHDWEEITDDSFEITQCRKDGCQCLHFEKKDEFF